MDNRILENYEKLNLDYLLLCNNDEVKKALYLNKRPTKLYKVKKMIEILFCLGLGSLVSFLRPSCSKRSEPEFEVNKDNNYKIAVYTSIFGNIDKIIEPLCKPENVDYFIITDGEVNDNSLWKKVDVPPKIKNSNLTNQYKNRYCKIFPDKFFSGYDYSIYVDGNIFIISDLSNLISRLDNKEIGIFSHPYRDDIYTEAAAVLYLNNAKPKDVKRQMDTYKREGFPKKYGLYENSLIVRKTNCEDVDKLMNLWWKQLIEYTCRDQLSLMYAMWKLGYDSSFIASLGANIDLCPMIRRVNHKNK